MRKYLKNNKSFEEYCCSHGLDVQKILKLPASYNSNMICFQIVKNQENRINGILNENPAKVILKVTKEGETLSFEASEDILEYVSK